MHHHVRGTGTDFFDLSAYASTQLVLGAGDQSRGQWTSPSATHLQSRPPLPSHAQSDLITIPLFNGEFSSPFFLLLQPPASFFQLGERVGSWIGRHGRILDEGMRRLDDVSELGTDPWMHRNRSLNGEGSDHIMGQLLLST